MITDVTTGLASSQAKQIVAAETLHSLAIGVTVSKIFHDHRVCSRLVDRPNVLPEIGAIRKRHGAQTDPRHQ